MYLLRRRLRHLNAISIYNVSLIRNQDAPGDLIRTVSSFFVTIEDLKGRCLYVSEVQGGSQFCAQFNEIPHLPHTLSRIKLKIVGLLPNSLLKNCEEPVWAYLACYTLDFSQLCPVLSDDVSLGPKTGVNIPVLQFSDGLFSLPGEFQEAPQEHSETGPKSRSFNFNGALKLNKIIEYLTQLQSELAELSHKIDNRMIDNPRPLQKEVLMGVNEQLEYHIKLQQEKIKSLETMRCVESFTLHEATEEARINEEYGYTFSEYTNAAHSVQSLAAKKVGQLLDAMEQTGLCAPDGFVVVDASDQSSLCFQLKKVDIFAITDSLDRISKNSLLGYYLLFVHILAEKIFYLPLPHKLSFYGSTSVIDNTLPLFLTTSPTQQHIADFEMALNRFNLDVMQVSQFLETQR